MNDWTLLLIKCLIIGIIWATFLLPVVFKRGSALKYFICAAVVAALAWFFRGYGGLINQMTIILLVALVISWITSMAFLEGESRMKPKIIAFTSLVAAFAYMITTLFVPLSIL